MHTTDEASYLWCPMVRIARRESVHVKMSSGDEFDEDVVVAGCNTDALGRTRIPESCRCIAEKCAMWRWQQPDSSTASGEQMTFPPKGFCGLAGTPHANQ